jgi:large subunit ribosomal protein L35
MPKMKSHSGTRKRVKITGTGKLMRQQGGLRHNMEKKSQKVVRRMSRTPVLSPSDAKKFNKLLGK